MMYVLNEHEFKVLNEAKRARQAADAEALQRVCTLAAQHVPVVVSWSHDKTPRPWGCILDPGSNPGYCDCCPVSEVCPCQQKEWSK